MPFLNLTKGSRRFGIQTYQRAMQLAPPLKEPELAYLNLRDWYVNQIALLKQFEEALEQAKMEGDRQQVAELGKRLHHEACKLTDFRDRTRLAGERSWAEAFYLAATHMLPKDIKMQIEIQADQLIGRQRHELAGS